MVAGLAGAYLGYRLRLPAGVLVGTIVGIGGAVVLLGSPPVSPSQDIKRLLQIPAGLIVGLRISRDSLRAGGRVILPAFLLTGVIVLVSLVSALATVRFTGLDPTTALFAAVPGGLTEMAAVSVGLGADGAAVTAIHLCRVLLTVAIVNVVLLRWDEGYDRVRRPASVRSELREASGRWFWAAMLAGVLGGMIGLAAPIPAGGVVGTVIGCAAVRLWRSGPVPSGAISLAVQGLSGTVIGLGISAAFFDRLAQLGVAAVIILSTQMLLWLLMSRLLASRFAFDRLSAIFAAAPGGMSEVISTASAAGADTTVVAFAHLVRLSIIILIVPNLILLFISA